MAEKRLRQSDSEWLRRTEKPSTLGHNDPKQNNNQKRHKWKEHEYTNTMRRASANKQVKQCFLQAPLHASTKSIALCLQRTLPEREKPQLIIKQGSLKTGDPVQHRAAGFIRLLVSVNCCVEVNCSIMMWHAGTWRVTGAKSSKHKT